MNKYSKGFTFIELLIVILISALLLGAITIFVGRIFNVNREHQEQVLITEDARNNIKRMADSIRDANNVIAGDHGEKYWLELAQDYQLIFYSNIDGDGNVEKVHYYIDGVDLVRAVTEPNPDGHYPPGQEYKQITILSRNVRNLENGVPLFVYHSAGNGDESLLDTSNMENTTVKRIFINLHVDVNPNQLPTTSKVSTQVTPRKVVDPRGIESERLEPIDIVLPNASSSSNEVTLIWPGLSHSEVITVVSLNSHLSTYHQRRKNWTTRLEGEWRVKVLDDVIPLSWLQDSANGCLAPEYDDVTFVLANCDDRTATDPDGNTVNYQPVFIYTDPNSATIDYIRNIEVEENPA